MAKLLKLRRGSTSQHSSFTGAEGEVTVDTDKETLVVHDGSTAGGHPVAAEDMANVSGANIKGRLGTTLTNAEINASAAIAGTKISPDFGSQNITTTGNLGGKNLNLVHTAPTISLTDNNADDDFEIKVDGGNFKIIDATNSNDRFAISSSGNITATGSFTTGSHNITGNITISGTVDGRDVATDGSKLDGIASGATNNGSGSLSSYLALSGGTLTGTLNARSIVPTGNYDLGSTSSRWRNIYTQDLQLSNEAVGNNGIDGTWGNYTIVEGESDLFLKNNRSGKIYKFNLTEVS
jgi:hypothetical protein